MTSHGNALVPTKPYTLEYRLEAGSVSIELLLGIHVYGDSAVVYVFWQSSMRIQRGNEESSCGDI